MTGVGRTSRSQRLLGYGSLNGARLCRARGLPFAYLERAKPQDDGTWAIERASVLRAPGELAELRIFTPGHYRLAYEMQDRPEVRQAGSEATNPYNKYLVRGPAQVYHSAWYLLEGRLPRDGVRFVDICAKDWRLEAHHEDGQCQKLPGLHPHLVEGESRVAGRIGAGRRAEPDDRPSSD